MRWLALLPVALFAALGGFFLSGLFREDPDTLPSALIGAPVPAMTITALSDLPVLTDEALADGEVKLVNFWASWCIPCRVEHPQIEILADQVPVYGINYKDEEPKALAFLEELGNPYTAIGADTTARTGLDWGVYGLPETFVVAGDGTITYRFVGPITVAAMEQTLLPAIEAARAR